METFDVTVIGGGPGGYPAAIRAAQRGAKVALVEREVLGGTCLNWGCIPTKTLIAASEQFWHMTHSEDLGLSCEGATFNYAAMKKRKDGVVRKLRDGVGMLLKGNGVTVFEGTGSFAARNRIAVHGKKARTIETGSTILATGSTSAWPGFLPRHKRVVESRAFLDRTALPGSMIVLGGGVIGCEFACMAAQLGVEVTVVEMLDDILPMLDKDLRTALRRHMESTLGMRVITGTPLESIAADDQGVRGTAGDASVEAELLLVSVGRVPVTDGLNLAAAGLETDAKGAIEVDACAQTRAASVYAIGDVTAGSTQLAHAATSQGITAAENACGERNRTEALVPACIFTAPEIGSVGLSEAQAAAEGRRVTVGKFSLAGLGKALAAGAAEGFVKWVADTDTDQLLGAHAVGAHATEWIAEAGTAIRAELTAEELGRTVHCHPTFGEAWMEAAHAVHGTCIHQPPRRKR